MKLKSKKTKTFSLIKLFAYAVLIYQKYQHKDSKSSLFGKISLFNFNKSLKQIGELAGFTNIVEVSRERQGKSQKIVKSKENPENRFCDKMSFHMMRRTAITTLLILEMPEHLVRKVSGQAM